MKINEVKTNVVLIKYYLLRRLWFPKSTIFLLKGKVANVRGVLSTHLHQTETFFLRQSEGLQENWKRENLSLQHHLLPLSPMVIPCHFPGPPCCSCLPQHLHTCYFLPLARFFPTSLQSFLSHQLLLKPTFIEQSSLTDYS